MMVKVDRWRLWVAAIGMMTLPVLAQADSLEAQRQRYQQVKSAWDAQQMDVVAQLLPTLRDYPLYPYLAYRQLSQDLSQVSPDQITAFIQANPTLPPARSLAARYVNELANRQDIPVQMAFSPQPPKPARRAVIIIMPNGLPASRRRPGTAPATSG